MLSLLVIFTSRCLMIVLFLPFSALDKILNTKAAVGQAEQAISPRLLARIMLFTGFGVEVIMSLGVVTGVADRLGAFILAGYCVVTALLWKQFWKKPDFRLKGESDGRETFWDFLKNLGLAGGFLLLAFGGTAAGVDAFVRHPFASSYPYATTDGVQDR